MLARDPNVVVFGEDVGYFGGVFRATEGLQKKYGEIASSMRRSPKAASWRRRSAWAPMACDRSWRSSSPITSIQRPTNWFRRPRGFAIARAASSRRRSRCARPMAAASSAARRTARALKRSSRMSAGLKTVIPSNPYDAKGLLISAIEDDDPGHLLRAEAALQRPVRRLSRQARRALAEAPG